MILNRAQRLKKRKAWQRKGFLASCLRTRKDLHCVVEGIRRKKKPEAKFAAAIDRFEPILQNRLTDYYTWKAHGISYAQLQVRNKHIQDGSKVIWEVVQEIFSEAKEKGEIKDE